MVETSGMGEMKSCAAIPKAAAVNVAVAIVIEEIAEEERYWDTTYYQRSGDSYEFIFWQIRDARPANLSYDKCKGEVKYFLDALICEVYEPNTAETLYTTDSAHLAIGFITTRLGI